MRQFWFVLALVALANGLFFLSFGCGTDPAAINVFNCNEAEGGAGGSASGAEGTSEKELENCISGDENRVDSPSNDQNQDNDTTTGG